MKGDGGNPVPIDMDAYINFILENFHYSSMADADRALKMHYETTFGIFDHRSVTLKGKRPWSSQAFHAGCDPGGLYAFEHLIDSFVEHEVKDILNMSWEVYCTLTHDQLKSLHGKLSKIKRVKFEEQEAIRRAEEHRTRTLFTDGAKQQSPGADARAMFASQR